VDTTGKDQGALCFAIVAGFNSTGLGLNVTGDSESFAVITNAQAKVTEIGATGLKGQIITQESFAPGGPSVPTLSEWGAAVLVGMLLLSTLWLLRRRGQS